MDERLGDHGLEPVRRRERHAVPIGRRELLHDPGDYLFAWWVSTAGAATVRVFGRAAMNLVGTYDGVETSDFVNGLSVSSVAAFPNSIAATDTGYARTGFSALAQPGAILLGT